jgi:anti-sigma B factor antagonist
MKCLQARQVSGIIIFDVPGKLTLGDPVAELERAIAGSLKRGDNSIILNMRDVSYADSSGIGQLIDCLKKCRAAGGGMKLLHVSSRVGGIMRLTRSASLFEFFSDETAAVRSFFKTLQT